MEEPSNKEGKRKAHILVKGGGGNIGGLVVWGGVLVFGSLMAAFTVKKRRQESTCDKKNSNHKGGSKQRLGSILQTESEISHQNQCDTIQGSTKSEVDLYGKDLILDQNPAPMINGSVECGHGDAYDFSFPVLDDSLMSPVGNGIKRNSEEFYMNGTEVSEEKIVDDVKIIALGMSKVHAVDAAKDYMARNGTGKVEKVVDEEKITTAEILLNQSAVEMEKVVDAKIVITSSTKSDDSEEKMEVEKEAAVDAERAIEKKIPPGQIQSADDTENSGENLAPEEDMEVMKDGEMVDTSYAVVEMEKVTDAEIVTSSTESDDSEKEKMEVEKEAAVDAELAIVKKIPSGQTQSTDDTENSEENLAPVENIEVKKDGEMVDTSYAVAKISSSVNPVGKGDDSRDNLPSQENNEVRNGRDLPNDERVIAETASSKRSVGIAVDQEEVEVKAQHVDLQSMESNDASKHKVSLASSFEEEDKSDGYVDNEEENGHESYTSDGGEDSPEGTETSSAESNSEKIWPVESLDVDLKDSAEKIMEDKGQSVINSLSLDGRKNSKLRVSKDDLQNRTTKKEEPMLLLEENRRAHLTKWRSWGLSIPALLLLLLLLCALHQALISNLLYPSFFVPMSSEN